jgi:tetratricopeptide (TPR) repeat protein
MSIVVVVRSLAFSAALVAVAFPPSALAQTPPSPQPAGPANADGLLEAARAAARADRNREAADLFAQALQAAPARRRELLQEYADQLVYSDRASQAVPLYREALEAPLSRDQQLRSLRGLGLALLWSDRPGEAREVYDALLKEQPSDQEARRGRARAASWSGRQREAVGQLEALLRDHPQDDEARVQLAQSQAWMGRSDLASATLSRVTSSRDDARKLKAELDRARAPRTTADVYRSNQSDNLDISGIRLGHAIDFAGGRGTAGVRIDRIDYEREDGGDSVRVTRPGVHGRYRISDSLELNGEVGRENIDPRGGGGRSPTVYATWLTLWPNDLFRFDLSTSRSTFDNLQSLRQGITARQHGLSMDITPSERQRYSARLQRSDYSDGNERRWGQLEGEYRLFTKTDTWVGLRHTRFEFERLLNNGYFNPLSFESTQATVRTLWRPDGKDGRWDVSAQVALGREHASPGGSKPAYDVNLRAGWRFDARTRLEARAQRFSSLTTDSGFARTTFGLTLDRSW